MGARSERENPSTSSVPCLLILFTLNMPGACLLSLQLVYSPQCFQPSMIILFPVYYCTPRMPACHEVEPSSEVLCACARQLRGRKRVRGPSEEEPDANLAQWGRAAVPTTNLLAAAVPWRASRPTPADVQGRAAASRSASMITARTESTSTALSLWSLSVLQSRTGTG